MARRILRDYFGENSTLFEEQARTLTSEMESYYSFQGCLLEHGSVIAGEKFWSLS